MPCNYWNRYQPWFKCSWSIPNVDPNTKDLLGNQGVSAHFSASFLAAWVNPLSTNVPILERSLVKCPESPCYQKAMPPFPFNFAPGFMGRKPPIPCPILYQVLKWFLIKSASLIMLSKPNLTDSPKYDLDSTISALLWGITSRPGKGCGTVSIEKCL